LVGFRFNRPGEVGAIAERFLHSLCAVARDRGYGIVAFGADTDDEEISAFGDLMSRGSVDGFALMGSHRADQRTSWLASHGARFVSFGRPWDRQQPAHAWVDVDGRRGLRIAVDHLAAYGHRRIAFIGWPGGNDLGDDRSLDGSRAQACTDSPHVDCQGGDRTISPAAKNWPMRSRPCASHPPRSSASATPWPWVSCERSNTVV
jgi:DNA-binding LacI/PurR family transcriptional regulator